MKYDTEEPVEVVEDGGWRDGSTEYKHPSHGMVRVSRYTGGGGADHHGSSIAMDGGVTLKVSKCSTRVDLGRNWYYAYQTVTEIDMTHTQYAELISTPNTQGVPCTLKYTQEAGHIKYAPIPTMVESTEEEIDKRLQGVKDHLNKIERDAEDILSKKGALNKSDKASLMSLITSLHRELNSSIPYYEKCVKENLDKMRMEAQIEIESNMYSAINKLGLDAIKDREVLTQLLEKKDD